MVKLVMILDFKEKDPKIVADNIVSFFIHGWGCDKEYRDWSLVCKDKEEYDKIIARANYLCVPSDSCPSFDKELPRYSDLFCRVRDNCDFYRYGDACVHDGWLKGNVCKEPGCPMMKE